MWYLIIITALILYVLSDAISKVQASEDKYAAFKLRIATSMCYIPVLIIVFAFDLGESGLSLFELIKTYPLIILVSLCTLFCVLILIFSFRYAGLTLGVLYGSASAPITFIGMLFVNLLTGKLGEFRDMLASLTVIPLAIMIIGTVILPNIEKNNIKDSGIFRNKKTLVLGIMLGLCASVFDCLDSVLSAIVFDGGKIGYFDFISVAFTMAVLYGIIIYFILWKADKKPYNPFKKANFNYLLYGVLAVSAVILDAKALSMRPVENMIFWIAYPVFPMIFARICLKEKFSLKQSICIGIILMSSVTFCIMDELM